jgi:hypothetical protein
MSSSGTVRLDTVADPVEVTPGLLDDAASHAYHNGQCVALALALHAQTGWPLVCLLTRGGGLEWQQQLQADGVNFSDPDWFDDFVHALVEAPDGTLLDIDNRDERESYEENACYIYGCAALVDVEPQVLRAAYERAVAQQGCRAPLLDLEVAASFAASLLAEPSLACLLP